MQITSAALKAVIVAYADLFLALFFVCLKVCVRYRVTCGLGFDDALAVLAWFALIPLVVLIHLRKSTPSSNMSPSDDKQKPKMAWATTPKSCHPTT